MSLMNTRGQSNPSEETDVATAELKAKVARTVEVLELNSKAITWWFWKLLLAFNLVVWSVALCVAFVKWVP